VTPGKRGSHGLCENAWMNRAVAADALTVSRLGLGLGLFWLVALDNLGWGAGLVFLTWVTDFLDGRLARSTPHRTRLAAWDFRVDTTVGVGLACGLAIADHIPWTVVIGMLVLAAVTAVLGNPAPAMVMMGVVYGFFMWMLLLHRPLGWWLPFVGGVMIGIIDWHRFTRVIMPAFFKGLAALVRGRSPIPRGPAIDDWA